VQRARAGPLCTLQYPAGDESFGRPREGAARRRGREQPETDEESSSSTRHIGHAAAADQQSAEDQHVRGKHPLQLAVGEFQP